MKNTIPKINPWYVTGLTDGEGCFSLALNTENRKRKRNNTISSYTYWVTAFHINLRIDDFEILDRLKEYFNCGSATSFTSLIQKQKGVLGTASFHVKGRKDLTQKVIPHFDKYPLQAKKRQNYELWKEAVTILFNADQRRTSVFSSHIITVGEENRLRTIKRALAETQTGGHKRIAMGALTKKPGKIVRKEK